MQYESEWNYRWRGRFSEHWQLFISTAAQAIITIFVMMRFILQTFNRLKFQIPAVAHIWDLSTGTDNAFRLDLNDLCHG